MSLAQDLARAHRERQQRLNIMPARPVLSRDFGQPWRSPVLTPNRHDYWPDKTARSAAEEAARFPRIRDIQVAVCEHYSVGLNDIMSVRRTRNVVRPRQVGMYLCRKLTPHSFLEIGRRFGGRDHTTVLHAFGQIERLMRCDQALAADIAAITALVGGRR